MVNIAIDGPSGAGKSTIAKAVAKDLGYIYVDSGAMYRALGLAVYRSGMDPDSESQVSEVCKDVRLELKYLNGVQRILLNDEDVSDLIRTPEISDYASRVSALPWARAFLLDLQRDMALNNSVIMDGRDIGTVILPNADVKIFLHADVRDRARRRWLELQSKGNNDTYDDVLTDICERDERDSTRAAAPLRCADDAIDVDTTGNELEESIQIIKNIILEKLRNVL